MTDNPISALAVLRQRVELRRKAEDAKIEATQRVMNGGGDPTAMELAAIRLDATTATAVGFPIEEDLLAAMKLFAEGQNATVDDELAQLFGMMTRVEKFCRAVGITLADKSPTVEARRYVTLTVTQPYVIIWLDLSREPQMRRHQRMVHSYAQAMRTAISRMRAVVKASDTKRLVRKFGIVVKSIEPITLCPGLYRVVLDARTNEERDKFLQYMTAERWDALTLQTDASIDAPSAIEQKLAVKARGYEI
jgi:hypothetical protein